MTEYQEFTVLPVNSWYSVIGASLAGWFSLAPA